ncbi:MAG: ABC transporter substrate-binding protein [Pseudodesulfovibrio sp.]
MRLFFKGLSYLTSLFLLAVFLLAPAAHAKSKPLVVFANPGGKGDAFFQLMDDFMQAAADDLGFELVVYHGDRNHVLIDENIENIFSQDRLPDYLIGMNARGSGVSMLKKGEAAHVKSIIINQSFLGEERDQMRNPGEKYKEWLFEYLPDDTQSGYLLAKSLIEKALADGLVDKDGKVNIIGISGHETSAASILREKGLAQAVKEFPQAQVLQVTHAGWKRDRAREIAQGLLIRHPDATVFWSASDMMAAGIADGIRDNGKRPGKDVLTGGVDWANFALDMVESGVFTVTVGGHFMDGAWGLVMLYDQIHGKTVPTFSNSHFSSITAKNVASYRKNMAPENWDKIDFKKFSKHLNPKLKEYDFSLEAILKQFKK